MTDYKATSDQWAQVQKCADVVGSADCSAILELCARVKVLEDAAQKHDDLRAARRPKPSSLKGKAYAAIDKIERSGYPTDDLYTLRRALEQLDD